MKKRQEFFDTNQTKSIAFRLHILKILENTIHKYEKEIIEALQKDLNKNEFDSYMSEIGMVLTEISYISKHLKSWAKPQKVKSTLQTFGAQGYIYKEPYGQVLIIAPWNYPFLLAIGPLVGAISAGNVACVKPSEYAVETKKIIEKIIKEVFPANYVTCVQGEVEETTALLNQKWDYIFFTGSSPVGKIVMEKASKHLTPVTLELGGKCPTIICEDANLDVAVKRIVWGKFINAGQTCIAPDYILVDEKVKEPFLKKLTRRIEEIYNQNQPIAKIINERHFNRLLSYIDEEQVYYGGKSNHKLQIIEPTILLNVKQDDPVMQEEIFGPILPVLTFTDEQEIMSQLKQKDKPLAFYLFTENKSVQEEFLTQLSFGGGCINDVVYHLSSPHLPFGGVGNSGMGAYHGKATFDTFTHHKSVLKQTTAFDLPIRYGQNKYSLKLLKRFLK